MPYISVDSGALTAEQKKELIERLTATAAEIIHIPAQFFTVTIKELPDENFGIGGKSIDEIKRNYKSLSTTVFKTVVIDHSTISPILCPGSSLPQKRCKGTGLFSFIQIFKEKSALNF